MTFIKKKSSIYILILKMCPKVFRKIASKSREGVIIDHDVIVIFPLGRFY